MSVDCKVAVIGWNGYVGRELVRLLQQHPNVQLMKANSVQDCVQSTSKLNVVFLATPPNVSMESACKLIKEGVKVIDLSGAYRLAAEDFTHWYGIPHEASFLIDEASYGLSPWASYDKVQLIANPGCYATAALMALLPLLKSSIIDAKSIIIDAKSGVSGGGKKAAEQLMFCEIANNFYPYKIGKHQHIPEIQKAIFDLTNHQVALRLITSILPVVRGISMTIYLKANSSFSSDSEIREAVFNAFKTAYDTYPLVLFKEVGKGLGEEDQKILELKQVIHTPYCKIGYFINDGQITLFSSIDNLLKGAASQAIENLNALYQLPLQTGLTL